MSRSWLETNGWLQGSLISSEDLLLLKEAFTHIPEEEIYLITASQSCDVCGEIEKEQFIEFSVARVIEKPNGLYLYNKNPRRLHLTADQDDGSGVFTEIHFELLAYDKIILDKSQIAVIKEIEPCKKIIVSDHTINQYADWLAARYNRPALPTNFERRFDEAWKRDNRSKATGKLSESILGIYVDISPDSEIPDTESYEVDILVLITQEVFDDTSLSQRVEGLIDRYAEAMVTANFTVGDINIRTEAKVSLSFFRSYKRIILDNLSYKNDECLPIKLSL